MLNRLAHPMATPFAIRKAAQAAALTLSLIGHHTTGEAIASAEGSYVAVGLPRLMLWATRCDPPLLLNEARERACATGHDVIIVRLGSGAEPGPPVTFDWVSQRTDGVTCRVGLAPALPSRGGLILVSGESDPPIDVLPGGIVEHAEAPSGWPLERVLATARAAGIYRSHLWGGM
jgi:hypothetical protein